MIFHDSVLYQLEMKELKGNCVCPPLPPSPYPFSLTGEEYATVAGKGEWQMLHMDKVY